MHSGFRIGRIAGISIRIDWSWIFIFLLVTWNLAAAVFPQLHPDWGPGLNWGLAVAAALLFFASVLAHELAHSLVAKSRGLPVRRITLFLFGGVSNIEREPSSPGTEFIMAIVGPLTSIVLGVIFFLLGRAATGGANNVLANPLLVLSSMGPLATLLLWLGPINILLGIFNMIPGFPLDGGRVLRSILWGITGNLRRATRWASWIGQIIAWIFIVTGIAMVFGLQIPIFGTGIISGIWLAFIGWFLNNAAVSSYQQVVVMGVLEGVPVAVLMRPNVPTVSPNLPISDFVHDWLMGTDERSFPVVEGDELLGMASLEDVRRVPRTDWDVTTVRQIMTPADQLVTASPREDATEAFQRFSQRDVRQMPVLQDGHLVGLLRRGDVMRFLQLHSDAATG